MYIYFIYFLLYIFSSRLTNQLRKMEMLGLGFQIVVRNVAGSESVASIKASIKFMTSMKEFVSSFQSFSARLSGLGQSTSKSVAVVQEPLPSVSARSLPPLVLETVSLQAVSAGFFFPVEDIHCR